jgi:two-component system, OmpR family, sensor kinase
LNSKVAGLWERISLRSKLTALSMALIGVLLVVSSLGTIALLRTYLQQSQDSILISTATVLRTENPLAVEARLATRQLQLPNLPTDYYIAYLNDRGDIILALAASTNTGAGLPNVTNFDLGSVIATRGVPFEVDLNGVVQPDNEGRGWRIVAVPLASMQGSLVVALPTDLNNGLVRQYRAIGLGFGVVLLLLSGLSIWLTITRALRPLKEVERTAAAVASGETHQRLMELEGTTEMARVNRSLNTMLDSIDQALTDRGRTVEQMRRFLADASHELRTPLVSVRGYAELYRMGALKDKAALDDALGRIESEAIRMSSLVENLLALARIDEAQPLVKAPTNMVSICRDAAKDASVAEYKRGIRVLDLKGVEVTEDAQVSINAEANAMRQVVINLLANACRFSPEEESVEVALGIIGDEFVLEVRDRGEGIPEALRDKVFERFFRADNSRNRDTGGSGLGLSICKALVTAHDGTIAANETTGGGTTIRVVLPL